MKVLLLFFAIVLFLAAGCLIYDNYRKRGKFFDYRNLLEYPPRREHWILLLVLTAAEYLWLYIVA